MRGRMPADTATTAVLGAYFLMAPQGSLEIQNTVGFVFFIAGGMLMSFLGGRFDHTREEAIAGRRRRTGGKSAP